jgi:hypothetical protein
MAAAADTAPFMVGNGRIKQGAWKTSMKDAETTCGVCRQRRKEEQEAIGFALLPV